MTPSHRYGLSAHLTSASGVELDYYDSGMQYLTVGNAEFPMHFDGQKIGLAAIDGPYQLREVRLTRLLGSEITLAEVAMAFTTQPYSRHNWWRDEILQTGDATDEGVDTNNNGLYDYLRVVVPLDVLDAGTYSATADLLTADNSRIVTATVQGVNFVQGANSLTLDFNGVEINSSGVDGPYRVAHLTIHRVGPLATHLPVVLASTAPYSSNSFESCTLSPDYLTSTATGAAIVPGTSYVPGSTCNSCTVPITLPFSYSFYGTAYSTVNVSNSGVVQFVSNNASGANTCLPNAAFNDAIFAYWDNFNTNINDNMGMYTSVTGSAPNRIFNIEWRAGYASNDVRSGFEVRLYEGQPKFEVIYANTRHGFSATVGVQKGTGERSTQYACNTNGSIPTGLKVTFDQRTCQ